MLPNIKDGMDQTERALAALIPGYIHLDERDVNDLLQFTSKISAHINYYNVKNEIAGNWEDFFTSNLDVLIIFVSKFDFTTYINKYEALTKNLQSIVEEKEMAEVVNQLFNLVFHFASLLIKFRRRIAGTQDRNAFTIEFEKSVQGLDIEIAKLESYRKKIGGILNVVLEPEEKDTFIKTNTVVPNEDIFGPEEDVRNKIIHALPFIDKIFLAVRTKYGNLSSLAEYYLKTVKTETKTYDPHLALYVAFLHLYQYLQKQLNEIPRKHLDYYYKDVLGIQKKPAVPDKTFVVLSPAVNAPAVVELASDEFFRAPVQGADRPVDFIPDDEVTIRKAKIKQFKTLYIGENVQESDEKDKKKNIIEQQVYKSEYDAIDPSVLLKGKKVFTPWPLQGEEQQALADDKRTMQNAELGLLIASPILFHKAGNRDFKISLFLDKKSCDYFKEYVNRFAMIKMKEVDDKEKVKKKDKYVASPFSEERANSLRQLMSHRLLHQAFNITLTTAKGWLTIKKYSAKFNVEGSGDLPENAIVINFVLDNTDAAIDLYDPAVHGQDCTTPWPVIKLSGNNYSFHNPYSFFRNMTLERVGIKVAISGTADVKLQNNIGALNASKPFQLFGPLPGVGSYLDLANTNLFNKYTQHINVNIDWLDLPQEGFKSYYSAYHMDIDNDSFKVAVSSIDEIHKGHAQKKQVYNLFRSADVSGQKIAVKTNINNVDIINLQFDNEPRLRGENEITDIDFKEGTLRMELTAPDNAFGQKVYPQIFSDDVLHNSKIFNKKRPLPNPPYIPVAKSVTLDVVLEHTELLRGGAAKTPGDTSVKLIHKYPFGYRYIYPSEAYTHDILPSFYHAANLYIGLTDVLPSTDLSFLFLLEEGKIGTALNEPATIEWSYLDDNRWIPFNASDVILDTTNNFINTGLIKLRMPKYLSTGNTIVNPDLFWIRASTHLKPIVQPLCKAVFTNAVSATRQLTGKETSTGFYLPAGAITDLSKRNPAIESIWQPIASFGGRPPETGDDYNIRVSERLRHKERPLTALDISQFVLAKFPQVLKVKCIGAPDKHGASFGAADIQIVVVPKKTAAGYFESEQPGVDIATLYNIKKALVKVMPSTIKIEVKNPLYERVKVICKVKLRSSFITENPGYYLRKLNDDIKQHISPWLYDKTSDVKIGEQIYLSEVLNFIKKRPYVENVTGFSMLHFYKDKHPLTQKEDAKIKDSAVTDMKFITGSVGETILVSSDDHIISLMDEESLSYYDSLMSGIDSLLIAEELSIEPDKKPASSDNDTNGPNLLNDTGELFNFTVKF
ncbi:hypothetical protein ACI6Q2_08475 [Chitinophagaceae bacterium LWZ2-11]